jgi:DNA-binding transcriptional MerR regulator
MNSVPLPGEVAAVAQSGRQEAALTMLTISQLAAYAHVTVRAVRHYHAKGLLPEPERDHSGYRRYDAAAVVELIRIKTLADAGVPLSRVKELLAADAEEFAAAVEDIDRRLRAEIRERQRHREQIAQLAAGDSLALPPEAVDYLDRLRALDLPERAVELERDAWILVAAQLPDQMPALMAVKHAQLDGPAATAIYLDLVEAADWEPDDPRLPAFADHLVSLIEETTKDWEDYDGAADFALDDDLVELLDSVFLNAVPVAPRLLKLLEERGWTGWTRLERIDPACGDLGRA